MRSTDVREDYKELNPGAGSILRRTDRGGSGARSSPMIAMPFHPSNTYTIEELNANLMDILDETEKRAKVSLDGAGRLYFEE